MQELSSYLGVGNDIYIYDYIMISQFTGDQIGNQKANQLSPFTQRTLQFTVFTTN